MQKRAADFSPRGGSAQSEACGSLGRIVLRSYIALLVDCVRLEIADEVRGLAKILVREKAMPGPAEEGDAVHVAAAIVHRCEYLLTWNVRHMANPNKLTHLRNICRRVGFAVPDLVTPESLWILDESAGGESP